MSFVILNDFVNSLLFGKSKYKIPNNVQIHRLVLDIEKYVNVLNTIQTGGLLLSNYIVNNDLDNILKYLEKANACYYDGLKKNPIDLKLKSYIVKVFFNQLSFICKGNLEHGVTANSFIPKNRIDNDENKKSLDQLLQQEMPKLSLQMEDLNLSNKTLQNVLKLYDIKCKSMGTILDPFTLVLTPQHLFVDPVHWESVKSLKHFLNHYPENALTKVIKELLKETILSIINVDETLLPDIVNDDHLHKFIQNVNVIHNRIEKVESAKKPPKLIDVFQRLLALVKLDKLWISEDWPSRKEKECFFCNLYIKNVELENENKLLRLHLKNLEQHN